MAKTDERPRQRIYPTGNAYFPGVAAVERVVPADVADFLVDSGAFTRDRPAGQRAPDPAAREDIADVEANLEQFRPVEPVAETVTTEETPNA